MVPGIVISLLTLFANFLPLKELDEANSITRRLVSHFVQVPAAATQIKDVMLSVVAEKRQQFQVTYLNCLRFQFCTSPKKATVLTTISLTDIVEGLLYGPN
jgi:hypothetical protein